MQLTALFTMPRRATKMLAMKLMAIMLVVCLQVSAGASSQTVTYSAKNAKLETVFNAIRQQTGYVFFYKANVLKDAKPVNLDVKNVPIERVLQLCLDNQGLGYTIEDKTIVIALKEEKRAPSSLPEDLSHQLNNTPPLINISGRITDTTGQPLENVTVFIRGTNKSTRTDTEGFFMIRNVEEGSILEASLIGYQSITHNIGIRTSFNNLIMSLKPGEITNVIVKGNTGYQVIDKKHPGSFDVVTTELFNRRVSTDILSRIENLTPGVSFRNVNDGLLIRGRNSILSNVSPLIVLDNFPYDGDINNINPNDIESVTILKDAAATAQWGARAGNGVIVITTKKAKTTHPQVSFNSNVTRIPRPDYSSLDIISSADYIELEKWLFGRGYYDFDINNTVSKPPLTPVVETLLQLRNGLITDAEANSIIEGYKDQDAGKDLERYFYRDGFNIQNALSISGSRGGNSYYFSAGWDKNLSNINGQQSNRITLRTQNSFRVTDNFSINTGINYTQLDNLSGNSPASVNSGAGKRLYPYARLADESGNPSVLVRDYRSSYTDTAGNGNLADWKYRPLAEIDAIQNKSKTRDFIINAGATFRVNPFLKLSLTYQFENSVISGNNLETLNSYSTRNLINSFHQPFALTNELKFPVPMGDILRASSREIISHQGRAQVEFKRTWNSRHDLSTIAGWEIKDLKTTGQSGVFYGYNHIGSIINSSLDFVNLYTQYNTLYSISPSQARIPNSNTVSENLDRFISTFINGMYTFKGRYIFSASARNDAANLFGVSTNQKGVPLWSVGVGWVISEEKFLSNSWLQFLKLRATYGASGNFSRIVSALPTATYNTNPLGLRDATIQNPPNKNLRWEQVRTLNIGLDFSVLKGRISGTVEYFGKNLKDLMGIALVDPTTGLSTGTARPRLYGNLASMSGNGAELNLQSINLEGKFRWETNFLFSYVQTKVTDYLVTPPSNSLDIISAAQSNVSPIIGKPLFTIYRFPSAGLDPITGDPRGYYNHHASADYNQILYGQGVDSLVYFGAVQPPIFGAIRNTFLWKNFSLSVNASYKFCYYFQRNSISYAGLYSSWTGHSDYARRWQQPGDEQYTNVPSRRYITDPDFNAREQFYFSSESLIKKGDHIRLDDINISYSLVPKAKAKLFSSIRIYAYLSNLNVILWTANKQGIDPYLNGDLRTGMNTSLGFTITF